MGDRLLQARTTATDAVQHKVRTIDKSATLVKSRILLHDGDADIENVRKIVTRPVPTASSVTSRHSCSAEPSTVKCRAFIANHCISLHFFVIVHYVFF